MAKSKQHLQIIQICATGIEAVAPPTATIRFNEKIMEYIAPRFVDSLLMSRYIAHYRNHIIIYT